GIELLLEYGRQARCWYVTQAERARYRIAFGRGFLERAFPVQPNLPEQGIDRSCLEAAQLTRGGEPAAGTAGERFQAIRRRGLAPGEAGFAGKFERVGEIVGCDVEESGGMHQVFGRNLALAQLDVGQGLTVIEA